MSEIMRRVALLGLLVVPTVLSFSCIQTIAPENCELTDVQKNDYSRYFSALRPIYGDSYPQTGLEDRRKCGWKQPAANKPELPMFVMSVGLEGAGHHLYSELFKEPVFDCLWINGRHYARDVADGVPRTTPEMLKKGLQEQLQLRRKAGRPPCRSIFDAEDSFPTGAIRKNGRVFMHPDMVNTQKMHGDLFNVKYVLILRNTTDTALSALRRNFVNTVEEAIRIVEMTLSYIEASLKGVPCENIFVAHYEHILGDPMSYLSPLSDFLELGERQASALKNNLNSLKLQKRGSGRTVHKLTQYSHCSNLKNKPDECYRQVVGMLDRFFDDRKFMWPLLSGNGFNFRG